MTTTTVSNVPIVVSGRVRVSKKPNRLAVLLEWVMGYACVALRHAGGCGLLNQRFYLFYDDATDRARIEFATPPPLQRLYRWAIDGSLDHRFERFEP